jgi:hypothetical protein
LRGFDFVGAGFARPRIRRNSRQLIARRFGDIRNARRVHRANNLLHISRVPQNPGGGYNVLATPY